MEEAFVEMLALATLADASAAVAKGVGRADYAIVVCREDGGHAVAPQDGQDGLCDLPPNEVNVGDVWAFVAQQLVELIGCLKVVEVIDEVLDLAKDSAARLLRFGEVALEGGGEVALPFQAEVDYLVAVLLQHLSGVEADRFGTAVVIIVYVNEENFHSFGCCFRGSGRWGEWLLASRCVCHSSAAQVASS